MGRIVTRIKLKNLLEPEAAFSCDALVDTGAAHLVLPSAWKAKLGQLRVFRSIECETATQGLVPAEVRGPVEIQIECFEPVNGEVLFVEMQPVNGQYEPLVGYIVLEQSQAAVDMLGHRLVHVKKADLKGILNPEAQQPC